MTGRRGVTTGAALALALLILIATLLSGCTILPTTARTPCVFSFKPFTVPELLMLRMHIDAKTTGKPIQTRQLEQIEQRTSQLRGLPLKKPVDFISMDTDCLRYILIDSQYEDTSKSENEANRKLLVALGLIPPTLNLEETITKVLTEQIAGFYDTKEKIITIIGGKTLTPEDQITMSHEITHALQDQNFNLEKSPLKNKSYDGDNNLAIESLVEGDATTTMVDYGQKYMTMNELLKVEKQASETPSTELDNAPLYLRQSLLFPYSDGMNFVDKLKTGGEVKVNAAFVKPPLSSEQIIHPTVYKAGKNPVKIEVPDISKTLGAGFRKTTEDALGEFDLDSWFSQFGVTGGNKTASSWAGNTIQYYQGPVGKSVKKGSLGLGNYVVLSLFQWDSPAKATAFMDDYRRLLASRYKKSSTRVLRGPSAFLLVAEGQFYYCGRSGNRTLLLQSDQLASITKALSRFPGYPAAPTK